MSNDLPVFTTHRTFSAPRALVWQAWTDPKMVAKWFGPKGSECTVLKHELKVGGIVHSCMDAPGMGTIYGKFTYVEIVPQKKLVWKHSFSDEGGVKVTRHPFSPNWPLELMTTVVFKENGDKTDITLTWVPNGASPDEIETFRQALDGMQQGWGGSFEMLDAFLKETKAA